MSTIRGRVDAIEWSTLADGLDEVGIASTGPMLDSNECNALIELYDSSDRFRSTIDMASHRFGRGQYRYFNRPLPAVVAELRAAFWPHLLPVARDWAERRGQPSWWPDTLDEWLDQCHAAGQSRPTP